MRNSTDLKDARGILSKGDKYVEKIIEKRAWKFGKLTFFDKSELRRTEEITELISDYISDPYQNKPLCIAVFGPPGSGKSFAVREINSELQKRYSDNNTFPYSEVNLTQIHSQTELSEEMRAVYIAALEEGATSSHQANKAQKKFRSRSYSLMNSTQPTMEFHLVG